MKCISWNVNGIRAVLKKDFIEILYALDADVFCIQETKAQPEQIEIDCEIYPYQYINSAEKKGYSGTMILCKKEPLSIHYGIGKEEHDKEGRVITIEYEDFYLVTVYTPNAQPNLKRIDYRLAWDQAFSAYVTSLDKPVVICGDLNVANKEIDLKNHDANHNNPGFSDQERESFKANLLKYYMDSYRTLYPEKEEYSWWSYRTKARERNAGWRIDYWLVSKALWDRVEDSKILTDVYGSDHCPIELDLN